MQSLGSGQKSVRWRSRRCIATSPTRSRSSAQPGRCMMSTVEGAPSQSRTPPRAATARACRARRATAGCLLPLTGACGPGSGAQSASSASGVMWQSVPCTTVFKSGGSCGRQKGDRVRPASCDMQRQSRGGSWRERATRTRGGGRHEMLGSTVVCRRALGCEWGGNQRPSTLQSLALAVAM